MAVIQGTSTWLVLQNFVEKMRRHLIVSPCCLKQLK